MPRNYLDDPWPELQTLIANSLIFEAIEKLTKNPELLDRLSKGHQEPGIHHVEDESVLTIACAKGYSHVDSMIKECFSNIKTLIETNAETKECFLPNELVPNIGLSLIEIAAISKNTQDYEFLVKLGAREDTKNYLNKTPKELLADPMVSFPKIGDIIDVLFELHEKDSSLDIGVNCQDSMGNTPLHIACLHRDQALIKKLLENGANPTIKNAKGFTPLNILNNVKDYSYNEILIILAQYTGTSDEKREKKYYWTFSLMSEKKWEASREGCIKLLASSPHLQKESQPEVSATNRPFFSSKLAPALCAGACVLALLLALGAIGLNPVILMGIALAVTSALVIGYTCRNYSV